MELCKEFSFEASHILPKHSGKCHRLHGHSWKLRVYVKGEVNPETGFVMDYADIKKIVQPIVDNLDHRHLGTWNHPMFYPNFTTEEFFVKGLPFDFYPSSENLIMWIAKELTDNLCYFINITRVPLLVHWSRLELDETCTSKCILTREDYEGITRSSK